MVTFNDTQYEFKQEGNYGHGGAPVYVLQNVVTKATLRVSVNIPDVQLSPGEFLCKSYGENAGVMEALIAAGVASHTGFAVESGYVDIPILVITSVN